MTLDHVRSIDKAAGLAYLNLHQEAWDLLETLPPEGRATTAVFAVRLLICTGLREWAKGCELARLMGMDCPLNEREAAGRFYLALATALCGEHERTAALEAVKALSAVWPEGHEEAVRSNALASLW